MNYELAACRHVPTSVFFPEVGETGAQARAVCARCPVRRPCLELGDREKFGIWGGLSERERRRVRKARVST